MQRNLGLQKVLGTWHCLSMGLQQSWRSALNEVLNGVRLWFQGLPACLGKWPTSCRTCVSPLLTCVGRTLILVNRETLLQQTVAAVEKVWPGVDVGPLQGTRKNQYSRQVTVATVQV